MDRLLAQPGERYDLVVLDTAPVDIASDAFPLQLRRWTRIGKSTSDIVARLELDIADRAVQCLPQSESA